MAKKAEEFEIAGENAAVAAARTALQPFLKANADSEVCQATRDGKTEVQVARPWGDTSVAVRLPPLPDPLYEALNAVVLPERLTAIWHSDTKNLEVIWTALRLPKGQKEVVGRKFDFKHKNKKHVCHFKESSDRLIQIAKHTFPQSISDTNWRNLQSFSSYARSAQEDHEKLALDEPLSFWISNVDWDENAVIDLVNNLNFYLSYYDDQSAIVVVHPPADSISKKTIKTRYPLGIFPNRVETIGLDDNLISFWLAAKSGNPMMRFIVYFRIIEYAAVQYVDTKSRSELKKILSAPHRSSDLPAMIGKVMEALRHDKLDDVSRLKATIRDSVDPKFLWKEIAENRDFFSAEKTFDGGFKVKALISKDEKEEAFCAHGLERFSDAIRKIRNALSHGKDLETAGVITPTTRNLQLLLPWVHLIGTAAGEIVLYKDVT